MIGTIITKCFLLVLCLIVSKKNLSGAVDAYADDHRNDIITNGFGLLGYILTGWNPKILWWTDPAFAIFFCLYIASTWAKTANEQIGMLVGKRADPAFLSGLTFLAFNHHPKIVKVDTVRAYSFGNNFIAEVHIVLPPDMPLREAHDIGEDLEIKIEKMDDGICERAFVHLDWEWEHRPEHQ